MTTGRRSDKETPFEKDTLILPKLEPKALHTAPVAIRQLPYVYASLEVSERGVFDIARGPGVSSVKEAHTVRHSSSRLDEHNSERILSAMCSDAEGMNDELRQVFLDEHNKYRSLVAKGLAKNKLGGYAPKAARMLKMTYDCDVEANTMQYVKKCVFEHDSREERNYWGQSIWSLGAVQYNKTASAIYLAWQWSNKIGCAVYWCSDFTFAACEYNPA
ncbi:SCP-like protein [Teladorsagia circumcincta]|uniref:SCP-like protein n=1 Tax=Teladorsagia circumcincta TaxID=45464 RepID=A0A2G9UDP2_TELCI|nr:SCP-like protein [Teladorsagia circumcincta]